MSNKTYSVTKHPIVFSIPEREVVRIEGIPAGATYQVHNEVDSFLSATVTLPGGTVQRWFLSEVDRERGEYQLELLAHVEYGKRGQVFYYFASLFLLPFALFWDYPCWPFRWLVRFLADDFRRYWDELDHYCEGRRKCPQCGRFRLVFGRGAKTWGGDELEAICSSPGCLSTFIVTNLPPGSRPPANRHY